jgi:hypothetical protein
MTESTGSRRAGPWRILGGILLMLLCLYGVVVHAQVVATAIRGGIAGGLSELGAFVMVLVVGVFGFFLLRSGLPTQATTSEQHTQQTAPVSPARQRAEALRDGGKTFTIRGFAFGILPSVFELGRLHALLNMLINLAVLAFFGGAATWAIGALRVKRATAESAVTPPIPAEIGAGSERK